MLITPAHTFVCLYTCSAEQLAVEMHAANTDHQQLMQGRLHEPYVGVAA